jgi:3-oxoacyl-[acyl-carrier protein] reductase
VVHGRNEQAVEEVTQAIDAQGGEAMGVLGDLTDPVAVERLRQQVVGLWGSPDIVVANAGGSPTRPSPIEDISVQDWHAAIDMNLTATFLTVKAFLPGMKERGSGVIVTMSSAAARRPDGRAPVAYTAAKAGIELFTQQLAIQVGPFGVRANCVAPETILTESNDRAIPADTQVAMAATHPLRRLGTTQDVADAVLFLVGPRSPWITGIILDVAGGSVLSWVTAEREPRFWAAQT